MLPRGNENSNPVRLRVDRGVQAQPAHGDCPTQGVPKKWKLEPWVRPVWPSRRAGSLRRRGHDPRWWRNVRPSLYRSALACEKLSDDGAWRLDVAMQTAVGVGREVASASTLQRLGDCTRCPSISSSPASTSRSRNWCWTATSPTTRCTASRRRAPSTATTTATATCRRTFSEASICCACACAPAASTVRAHGDTPRAAGEEAVRSLA